MRFTLRDWNRTWFLAFVSEAPRGSGAAFNSGSVYVLLTRMLQDPGNLASVRNLLASDSRRGFRPVPKDFYGLLAELMLRLERRDLVLFADAEEKRRGGRGGAKTSGAMDAAAEAEKAAADFTPMEADESAPAKIEDAVPSLSFSMAGEDPIPFRFEHGSEKPPGLSLDHGSEQTPGLSFAHATEGGSALSLAHAVEGAQGMDHSSAVTNPS